MPAARASARPLGVVYTPPALAAAMARLALAPWTAGASADELLALRVADPAVGEGVFLAAVRDVLADAVGAAWARDGAPRGVPAAAPARAVEARRRVAARCLYGVDVDARALEVAREAVGLPAAHARVADALALPWADAFPAVSARGGFDVVIGNPPYIRQEQLVGKAALRGFAAYDGVADLYVYFVELAHRLLRPGGRYTLVVPSKWMTVAYGGPLRRFLAAAGSVEGVVDLGQAPLFDGADAFPCVLWGRPGAPLGPTIHAVRAARGAPAADPLTPALAVPDAALPRARWGAGPWHIDRPRERALLDRLEARHPPLADALPGPPARGVVTGCNRAFVLDRAARDRLLAEEPAAAALVRALIKGRDVRPWLPAPLARWILLVDRGVDLGPLPAVHAHLARFREALEPRPAGWAGPWAGRKPGAYRWYELQDPVGPLVRARAPRLFVQDIQTAPACCLDATGELVPDTTVWILPTDDRVLLAILNSPVYAWYAQRRFPPALGGAVRPKLAYLSRLPIPRVAPDLRAAITAAVDARLAAERGRTAEDPTHDATLARLIADAYELSRAERAALQLSG